MSSIKHQWVPRRSQTGHVDALSDHSRKSCLSIERSPPSSPAPWILGRLGSFVSTVRVVCYRLHHDYYFRRHRNYDYRRHHDYDYRHYLQFVMFLYTSVSLHCLHLKFQFDQFGTEYTDLELFIVEKQLRRHVA